MCAALITFGPPENGTNRNRRNHHLRFHVTFIGTVCYFSITVNLGSLLSITKLQDAPQPNCTNTVERGRRKDPSKRRAYLKDTRWAP